MDSKTDDNLAPKKTESQQVVGKKCEPSEHDLMVLSDVMSNMKLAHEIAIDPLFRISKINKNANSLHSRISATMETAFWQQHKELLNKSPPDYSPVISLLKEAKASIESLLPNGADRYKATLNSRLDLTLIEQQVKAGCLDLPSYYAYLSGVLGELCSPYRDNEVEKLRNIKDPIEFFKKMFSILEMMKLDMLNFTIQEIKPFIRTHSCKYERKKFSEYIKQLEVMPFNGVIPDTANDGLLDTKRWLIAGNNVLVKERPEIRDYRYQARWEVVMKQCLVELLKRSRTPETFMLDRERLQAIQARRHWLLTLGALVNVAMATQLSKAKIVSFERKFGGTESSDRLRQLLIGKMQTVVSPSELNKRPADSHVRLVEQLLKDIQVEGSATDINDMDELRTKLSSVEKQGVAHPLYELLSSRLEALLIENIPENPPEDIDEAVGKVGAAAAAFGKSLEDKHRAFNVPHLKLIVPSGMTGFQAFLNSFVHDFLALVIHNRAVHQPLYTEIYNAYILGGRLLESLHLRPTKEDQKNSRDRELFKNPAPESVIIGDQMDCSGKGKLNENIELPKPPTFDDIKFSNKSRKDKH